jgi:hypothetical protein
VGIISAAAAEEQHKDDNNDDEVHDGSPDARANRASTRPAWRCGTAACAERRSIALVIV